MNKQEALKILELDQSATEAQIKKQFRKLAAKAHPDQNKEAGAEEKFKTINEAYQFLSNPPKQTQNPFQDPGFDPFDFFVNQNFSRKSYKFITHPTIKLNKNFTFNESVLGCKQNVSYTRFAHCNDCDGKGEVASIDKCTDCNGQGMKTSQQNSNTFFRTTCSQCMGLGRQTKPCDSCHGECGKMEEKNLDVNFPSGLITSSTIRLQGQGHFRRDNRGFGYEDVFIHVFVEPVPNMKIDGINVISDINLSLLEALTGKQIKVDTVLGEKDLEIPALIRHNETVLIKNAGVGQKGDHIFKMNIDYPKDVTKLIENLKD